MGTFSDGGGWYLGYSISKIGSWRIVSGPFVGQLSRSQSHGLYFVLNSLGHFHFFSQALMVPIGMSNRRPFTKTASKIESGSSRNDTEMISNWRRYFVTEEVWRRVNSCSWRFPSWVFRNLANKSSLNSNQLRKGRRHLSSSTRPTRLPPDTPHLHIVIRMDLEHWYQSISPHETTTHRGCHHQK